MKFRFLSLALLVSLVAIAEDSIPLEKRFTPGEGSRYLMVSNGANSEVSVTITDVFGTRLGFEVYSTSTSLLGPVEMWQQFVLEKMAGDGPLILQEGYVLAKPLAGPRRLPNSQLRGEKGGYQMTDFLFADGIDLNKKKVGTEVIQVPAGSVQTDHYVQKTGELQLDYWIASSMRPIGLVKMNSRGPKKDQNYELMLLSRLKGVAPKISRINAPLLSEVEAKKLVPSGT